MNKTDLIDKIASSVDVSKADAARFLDVFVRTITEELTKGNNITIVGFGTFKVSNSAARTGRNPQTGAEIRIPASKRPKFTAGKQLKDAVNR